MRTLRSIEESSLYSQQVEAIADVRYMDEALEGVMWALAKNAELFPELPGTNIRVIKTREFERKRFRVTPLKVWFTILDENKVRLLAITTKSDEFDFYYEEEEVFEEEISERDTPF